MAWIYNDFGRGVVILDKAELYNMGSGSYFEISDDNLPEPNKEIETNGLTWWYKISEPELPDTETDIISMMIDHEYRVTLLELGITEE